MVEEGNYKSLMHLTELARTNNDYDLECFGQQELLLEQISLRHPAPCSPSRRRVSYSRTAVMVARHLS
jgi:hypothetical protein